MKIVRKQEKLKHIMKRYNEKCLIFKYAQEYCVSFEVLI